MTGTRRLLTCCATTSRRTFLGTTAIAPVVGLTVAGLMTQTVYAAALTKDQRDKMTPDQVIAQMKQGNQRFRAGKMSKQDYLAQKRATAAAVSGRGDPQLHRLAHARRDPPRRAAGRHLQCPRRRQHRQRRSARQPGVRLRGGGCQARAGHGPHRVRRHQGRHRQRTARQPQGLLDKIKPAVEATRYEGDRTSKNDAFVDEVAKTNVRQTVGAIRQRSEVLAGLEKEGKIKIVGSMYHLVGGRVEFLA